jgi:N-acetylglutamate synthase-like GNAT family acetyltransferase
MARLHFKFYPSNRLPEETGKQIQTFINQHQDAPIPETPTNSLLFIPYLDDTVLGYASVTINQKSAELSSIFIKPEYQQQLYGFQLMLNILDTLSKTGCQEISLNCSEELLRFFQRLGFILCKRQNIISSGKQASIYELENPCPDFTLKMIKQTLKNQGLDLHTFKQQHRLLTLNQDGEQYAYRDQHQFLAFHKSMLMQAQRQIWLVSDTIQSPLMTDPKIRDAILRLAKRNAKAEIRILLEDDKKGAGYYNPTIELAQKLTSFVEIRSIPPGAKKPNEMITTVDFGASILRKDLNNYAGFANYHNPVIAQRLRDKYEQYWQHATPSMQLRRLSI